MTIFKASDTIEALNKTCILERVYEINNNLIFLILYVYNVLNMYPRMNEIYK